jgi:hypothetical protein
MVAGETKPLEIYKRVNTETNVMLIGGYRMEKISMYTDTM